LHCGNPLPGEKVRGHFPGLVVWLSDLELAALKDAAGASPTSTYVRRLVVRHLDELAGLERHS